MKLIEAIKNNGCPFVVPDCSRNTLPEFFKIMGYKIGVEIGTALGTFMEKFCKEGFKMYGIDPWIGFSGQGTLKREQSIQDEHYEHAKKFLNPYKNCTIIRKTSMDAFDDFEDESLDFVYIDGDHDFRHTAEDIYEWNKKVKKGGVISGHDYWNSLPTIQRVVCHVKPVVDAYVKMFEIKDFYIFGAVKRTLRLSEENVNSWMWIKK